MSIKKNNKDWFDTHFEVIMFDSEGQEDKETATKLKEDFREKLKEGFRIEELESRVCSCGKLVEDCDEAYEHATSGA